MHYELGLCSISKNPKRALVNMEQAEKHLPNGSREQILARGWIKTLKKRIEKD